MSMTDPIADMLTRMRNGYMAKMAYVTCPSSTLKIDILEVLKEEGFIADFFEEEIKSSIKKITINLKYTKDGNPAIKKIVRNSKPGRRVYTSKKVSKVLNGLGISILSTPKGVMTDHEARRSGVGGEIICSLY